MAPTMAGQSQPPAATATSSITGSNHPLRHQLNHQLQAHRQAFLSKQLQCRRIQEWPMLQGMRCFQVLLVQIHGLSASLGASDADPR